MDDVQNQRDERGITIQQTGVNNVCLPFLILGQQVQAKVRFTVSLNKDLRGTHMSRLMEILTDWTVKPLSMSGVDDILTEALNKLNTNAAKLHIAFKYFVEREAPVSKRKSLLDLNCFFEGEAVNEQRIFTLGVETLSILVFVDLMGFDIRIIKLILIPVTALLNYLISKFFVFKNKNNEKV